MALSDYERQRRYRESHKEEVAARMRRWREANRETEAPKNRARVRAWAAAHAEQEKERHRLYRRRWVADHPDEVRASNAERLMLGGQVYRISQLPEELRPLARAIQEARREIKRRAHQ